jgi:hypothetical protein
MSRPHGRAEVDPSGPRAFGVCDRCGFWYNHHNLRWQLDYRGNRLQNLRILVCYRCYDNPQPQLKPRIIGPDPLPIINARPENFYIDETDFLVTDNPSIITTDDGIPIVIHDNTITILPVVSGSLAATDGTDVLMALFIAANTGVLAATEAADTMIFAPIFTGVLAANEAHPHTGSFIIDPATNHLMVDPVTNELLVDPTGMDVLSFSGTVV